MRARLPITLAVLSAVGSLAVFGAGGPQVVQERFEGREPLWAKGAADAAYRLAVHETTDEFAHRGHRSEHLKLEAEQGTHIHYTFAVGRAPVGDDFNAGLHIKANRPGVQLLARVVLPRERKADSVEEPLTVLLRGETYLNTGRWQRLDLSGAVKKLREQVQLLRYELKRDVSTADAFVDRLVLNLYGGPGLTEVWIDDLEVGPVLDTAAARPASRPREREPGAGGPAPAAPRAGALAELRGEHLMVRGERYFFRAIRHTDTPLDVLRQAGFNTIWFDAGTAPEAVEKASKLGFLIVPSIPLPASGEASEELARSVARFADQDDILFWDLGTGGLAKEQAPAVGQLARLVRSRDAQRPLAADVWDGFERYSRDVRLIGVHRWPLMTTLELSNYREWLSQRRLLAEPGPFLWTWVQTHLPDWYTALVYDRPGLGAAFDEPIGPQPEQVRLLTYLAVGNGCRGLGFWSDRFLADSHHGRDRLLTLALLNQELRLLEPLLVTAGAPRWIDTSNPSVKAAMMRCDRGWLVLPVWLGPGSQFVPGQGATSNLTFTVPVPRGLEAWEVTPADVRRLDRAERVNGGWRVTLPEFGLTSAIVFTADNGPNGLLVYFQNEARKMRSLAAQWSYQAAELELAKVQRIHEQLEEMGHRLPDGAALLRRSLDSLHRSATLFNDNNFSEAYLEAQRAMRPLRILMRAHWEEATRDPDLTPAVASPYAVSFYTLPRHWRFVEQLRKSQPGANVLPHGDFELPPAEVPPAWLSQTVTLDEVDLTAERVADDPKEGKQCLKLQITPKNAQAPPLALERTFLAIHSPAVRLAPGTLVKITAWVKVPKPIAASADGALFYDLAGGEPLAVRITGPTPWKQYTLYRKVPASGTINVTLALTGIGTAYFDDVRIEPLGKAAAEARVGRP